MPRNSVLGAARKSARLATLLLTRPREFADRVRTIVEVQVDRRTASPCPLPATPIDDLVAALGLHAPADPRELLDEAPLEELERELERRLDEVRDRTSIPLFHNADRRLARVAYALCRAFRPRVVLETGVASGVSSAYILKALDVNGGAGELTSVDLPPLGRQADRFVGVLIPESLRSRWTLERGVSRRLLPSLLERLGHVDFFLHDSLHTERNILAELRAVTPCLRRPAVVLADDIEGNSAFASWVEDVRPAYSACVREESKSGSFGVALLSNATQGKPT